MSLAVIILVIVCVGVALYCINRWVPMEATFKNILNIVAVIIVIIWLIRVSGVWNQIASVRI